MVLLALGGVYMCFDKEAAQWDTNYRINRAKKIAEEISSYLDGNNISRAMEFGCGTGLISFNLQDEFEEILLIDLSKGMIEETKKKIKNQNIKNMKTLVKDVLDIEGENKYDVIYTSMVLHHILNLKDVLYKLSKLLKPNGKLIIVELSKDDGTFHSLDEDFNGYNGFEIKDLQDLLKDVGFTNIKGRTFYHSKKQINDKYHEYSLFSICSNKQEA